MPEEAATVETFLRRVAAVSTRAAFVLAHGRAWGPPIARPGMRKGPARNCYENAARLVAGRAGWRYAEGYADIGPIVDHAWIVDDEGHVIEPTWPAPGAAYFGVAFTEATMRRAWTVSGWYSVLHDGVLADPAKAAAVAALSEEAARLSAH